MATFLEAARTAVKSVQCQVLAANDYIAGAVGQFNPVTRVTAPIALNAIRRLLGCPELGDYQNPQPAFVGGQCPGVLYIVRARGNNNSGVEIEQLSGAIAGPIVRAVGSDTGVGDAQSIFILHGNNQASPLGVTVSAANAATWRIVSVATTDGSPVDQCGSTPPVFPPPTNFNFDTDITYEIDDSTEVTVNVPFVFAPIKVDFNGTLRIPVDFSLGGFEFSGDINLPDFELTINPPGLPPGSGEDFSGQGEDEPGETTPPAPIDEKIIGIVVTATQTNSTAVTSYSTPGLTPIFIPRLGSIKFVYSLGAATFFSSDIDIKDRRTFIPCPFSQGADAVIASPNEGVNITFTPIRGFPLATTNDTRRST